ncbi:DUF192 domain-containing protein [Xylanimonas ulmi]|uniref:DUF192 domain-containing protein n=1 Tax=Xylanimonas ulmi TaxID=228973 RepID=A0A4Q7M8P2_9MICO|nr:DUF192 domain-containing protein [Xylanibacterium ulmi]RZS63078.1 hypothetical protein EV386_3436 [Xylanibacterium ulmi]
MPRPSRHRLVIDGRTTAMVEIADTWARRARGMLARRALPAALLLRPCASVHGVGMRVPLDVAFLTPEGAVLDVIVLRPWSAPRGRRGAAAVLEAPAGSFARWDLTRGSAVQTAPDREPS